MQAGSSQYIQQLQDLQKKLSSDDPINIQFTSVPLKILCSSCLALCLVIFDNHLSHCKNQRHTSLSHNDVCYQGTTGSPKGATLSHHNIVNNAYIIGRRVGYDWRVSKPRRQIDVCSLCANRYVLPCVSWHSMFSFRLPDLSGPSSAWRASLPTSALVSLLWVRGRWHVHGRAWCHHHLPLPWVRRARQSGSDGERKVVQPVSMQSLQKPLSNFMLSTDA